MMSTLTRIAQASLFAIVTIFAGVPVALATDYTVVLDKMKFGPVPVELHTGDTIIWQNHDIFRHSATARDKTFDIDLPPKAEVRMVVGPAGTVAFFCKFHPGMTGSLVILP